MSLWWSSLCRNSGRLLFIQECFTFPPEGRYLFKCVLFGIQTEVLDILTSCAYESNTSQEASEKEFLVSKTALSVILVDLWPHSPLVKFGLLFWIHFGNNDAGNSIIYYFNKIMHWTFSFWGINTFLSLSINSCIVPNKGRSNLKEILLKICVIIKLCKENGRWFYYCIF